MDGGGLSGNGGGLLCVGYHELLQDSIFVGDCIGHVVHIVIHFVEGVRGDNGGKPEWFGCGRFDSNSGNVGATELDGASTGLDLALKTLMRLDKCGFPQQPGLVGADFLLPLLHLGDKGLSLEDIFGGNGH